MARKQGFKSLRNSCLVNLAGDIKHWAEPGGLPISIKISLKLRCLSAEPKVRSREQDVHRHAPVQRYKEKSHSLLSPPRGRVQAFAVSINSINRMERQMGEIPVVH